MLRIKTEKSPELWVDSSAMVLDYGGSVRLSQWTRVPNKKR